MKAAVLHHDVESATTVVPFTRDYSDAWDAFVRSSSEGTMFHLQSWRTVVERVFRHDSHYLMALREGQIYGIVPLMEVSSMLFGHCLVSVPFGVYGGVLAADEDAREALINSAEVLATDLAVDYLELRQLNLSAEPSVSPEGWLAKDLYVTFRRPIYPTVEENLLAIPRKQRAMVRKGEKSGLTAKIGRHEHLLQFYKIYSTNVRDLGTPVFPVGFFRTQLDAFPDAFIFSIWKDKIMVAAVLTFVYGKEMLPFYGAGLREHFSLAINDYMYWELMKYGCENGFTMFDFGRSKKNTGAYNFKKNWGFEATELDYNFYLVKQERMPNVSPVNPKYSLMINTWKRLPLVVSNWLGPMLVRSIP